MLIMIYLYVRNFFNSYYFVHLLKYQSPLLDFVRHFLVKQLECIKINGRYNFLQRRITSNYFEC